MDRGVEKKSGEWRVESGEERSEISDRGQDVILRFFIVGVSECRAAPWCSLTPGNRKI